MISISEPWRFTKKSHADRFHLSHLPPMAPPRVSATTSQAMQAGRAFTLYSLPMSCPLTHQSWTTHKRYHDFVIFRKQLTAFKSYSNTIMVPVVEKLLDVEFPKKRWLARKSQSVAERAAHLSTFLWTLMEMRTEMCVYRHLHQLHWPLFDRLYACMEAFLDVPLALREMELRQAPLRDMDPCVICTNEYDSVVGAAVELPCGHAFHADCIFDWFQHQPTCPLCRSHTDRVLSLYEALPTPVS
ncbi:hypothetical protein ACHHYP_17112 [Achlya hypogyna]|uniref:RING-type domain-containing protein n=1 Tax=Achlya hypogyna TaxID=1202772 RepID=A0A1V9Y569_ACHHY|nr:hypothetical protein ACHHYP_17112 [Achlya hypogyna]